MLGHSTCGNIARVAAKKLKGYFFSLLKSGKISKMPNINLVTVNTPVQSSDQFEFDSFEKSTINSIGVVGSKFDWRFGKSYGQLAFKYESLVSQNITIPKD